MISFFKRGKMPDVLNLFFYMDIRSGSNNGRIIALIFAIRYNYGQIEIIDLNLII
ncbi:MAG: hypothetical protein KDD99_03940 [Bacteroidetes bacterium]|nr:hypothetical protein [Bacteroidota bacterium]